jgi:hypothetical protein
LKIRDTAVILAFTLVGSLAYNALSERSRAKCACDAPLTLVASAKSAPAPTSGKKPVTTKSAKHAPKKPVKPALKAKNKVVVTYFHSNFRCSTCLTIEAWSKLTVQKAYASELKSGRIQWRVINIDQPGSEHFKKDYNLSGSTVIVSALKNGKQARWKNLDKVWDLLGDASAFERYIRDEVDGFIKAS